jgi:mannose-6-phosphate isomerase-like protein (cupin superfamily)
LFVTVMIGTREPYSPLHTLGRHRGSSNQQHLDSQREACSEMKENLVLAVVSLLLVSQAGSGPSTLKSATHRFDDLVTQKEANATFRPILDDLTHSGYRIHVHEVYLLPGSTPRHGHCHPQEVLFLVSEGELQMNIAGKTANLGPGSAAFVASHDEHNIQNASNRPTQYFAVILDSNLKTPR